MNHEVVLFAILIAAMVACKPFDALVDLHVLLQVAALGETHLALIALVGFNLRVASHMRSKLAER